MVYLLHFSKKHYHAQHYIGSSNNIGARLKRHINGHGSKLVKAVVKVGITVSVVRTWEGGKEFERILHDRKNSPKYCPICNTK